MKKFRNSLLGLTVALTIVSVTGCGGVNRTSAPQDSKKSDVRIEQNSQETPAVGDDRDTETYAAEIPSPDKAKDIIGGIIKKLFPGSKDENGGRETPRDNAHKVWQTEAYLTRILDALEKGDTDALYAMYAPNVQNADPDLMRDVRRVAGMYKGTRKSYDFVDGSTSKNKGEKGYRMRFIASYKIETTEETYMILIGVNQQGVDEASTGVTSIALIRAEDYDAENELEEYYYVHDGAIPCDRQYLDDLKAKAGH